MLRIGLTGNIASGKSTVARCWRERGAYVIDADELARRVVEPGTETLTAIVQRWGPGMLGADGHLDRAALRDIVFRNPAERTRLEQITHPAIGRLREAEYAEAERRGEKVVVADIPLLYEVGLEKEFDAVVHVHAPEEARLQRIVGERGLDEQEARRMIAAQMPSERKRGRADYLIDNTGTLEDLHRRANEVWDELLKRTADR